jgi:hypothetical protein
VNGPSAEPPADLPTRALPRNTLSVVMAGLVPATHGFVAAEEGVGPRDEPGDDDLRGMKP